MNVERFLFQVQQNLPKHEGVTTWLEDSALKVGYGDTGSFEIRYPGGICYNAATEKNDEFYKLVEEADKTFKTVKEYIDLMDKAPELSARDFNMPYKLLAEFNGVVLGGIGHWANRSFEFTTWSYGNNSLYHGHYFTDYERAKEDFVVRSGLLQSTKLFTEKEMMQIYRCMKEQIAQDDGTLTSIEDDHKPNKNKLEAERKTKPKERIFTKEELERFKSTCFSQYKNGNYKYSSR